MELIKDRFKTHLFFDMDGVLADFNGKVRRVTGTTADSTTQEWDDIANEQSRIPGFFSDLPPIPGAIEAFNELSKHYDCHILSTAAWENPSSWAEKRVWVLDYLGEKAYKKLTLSHHKELFTGRALIDDRTANGADEFNGEHIHFGTELFPDWKTVVDYLKPKFYTWNG